jgi:hypothetical protein
MSNPAPSEELARIIESARRLGVELNEGDAASGGELYRFSGGAEYVDVVIFSPHGRLIASDPRYADENKIQVWGVNQ